MTSPYLNRSPRTEQEVRAQLRQQREAGDTDADVLDQLLSEAHAFRSAVLAAAPHLHVHRAREIMAGFADLYDDCMGDTLKGARKAVEEHVDDNTVYTKTGAFA